METLIMQPKNKEQLSALKAVAKALKIEYKLANISERGKAINLYGQDLVEKIEKAEKSVHDGNTVTLDPKKTLWENIL